MNLKHQLRHYLTQKEMSAADLARKSGIPKQTLSNWLSGMPPRNLDKLRKVCLALNVSIEELCFGDSCSSSSIEVPSRDPRHIVPEALVLPIGSSVSGLFEIRIKRVR